ncbi:MAG TPA: MBL fold metallo-hydrolase [Acidimicrobiales bacterium]|nr:MBL fold metallo-hydrolase [Acidimicrobiales bacterium]
MADFDHGPRSVAGGVVRITAANPGIMTGPGTNTYLVGTDELAVIDPGPDQPDHLDAVAEAGGGRIRWILVTHTHPDHAPGAAGLARRTGAPRLGFASRDGFLADRAVAGGFHLRVPGLSLRTVHTPGHASNHLCYLLERHDPAAGLAFDDGPARMLFSGDHVMQGSTVVISPPDGDMADYLASLRLVRDLDPAVDVIAPGHGHLIDDPAAVIDGYLEHRLEREAKVAAALRARGTGTIDDLLPGVYDDVDPERHPIARRSLWAHLRKLADDSVVVGLDVDDADSVWHWRGPGPASV